MDILHAYFLYQDCRDLGCVAVLVSSLIDPVLSSQILVQAVLSVKSFCMHASYITSVLMLVIMFFVLFLPRSIVLLFQPHSSMISRADPFLHSYHAS